MRLSDAKKYANKMLRFHQLASQGWTFEFDNAVRRFGVCTHKTKTISLSKKLTQLNSEEQVKDTILHEIAHAICQAGRGHDWVWEMKCIEIGAKPDRCYDSNVKVPEPKHLYACTKCGIKIGRNRRMTRKKTMYHPACGITSRWKMVKGLSK